MAAMRKLLTVAFVSIVLVSAIGIFEYCHKPSDVFLWAENSVLAPVIMEPETIKAKAKDSSFNWYFTDSEGLKLRVFGTFEDTVAFSAYLGMIIPFSLYLIYYSIPVIYAVPALVLILSVLVLTYTRSAYISFALMGTLVAFLTFKYVRLKKAYIAMACLVILVLGASLVFKTVMKNISLRFHEVLSSEFTRPELWSNGLNVFFARPLFGVGIANYHNGLLEFAKKNAPLVPAHNQYIQIAAETGIAGLLAYLSILTTAIVYSLAIYFRSKNRETRFVALGFLGMWTWYCVQSIYSTYLFGDKFSMMFWLMVGMNSALYKIYKSEEMTTL